VTQRGGALSGLRVIDFTDETGRYATKLLAEAGADVVMIGRRQPGRPMADPGAAARGGVLDWWFDGGKRRVEADIDTDPGRAAYRTLAAEADLIVETQPPGRLAAHRLDHGDLVTVNPGLVQVSLTPFGRTGPRAAWQSTDLVAGAMGGVLSVTGEPDAPLNSWGAQNTNFGGLLAVLTGLAAVRRSRLTGHGSHVDLSLHESVVSSIENLFFQWNYRDMLPDLVDIPVRRGSRHWLDLYELTRAGTGSMMITPTPTPALLFDWMVEAGHPGVEPFLGLDVPELLDRRGEVMALTRDFVADREASTTWWEAQCRHVAFGAVQSIPEVAEIPQYAHRDFLAPVDWDGPDVTMPARPARLSATPSPPPAPPPAGPEPLTTVMGDWARTKHRPAADGPPPEPAQPLAGVRVLDLTWVLAGPFATRLLGDLGADVVKIQTEERATLVNRPDYPYYAVWNRSKRSGTLNIKADGALDVIRRLVEQSDVLIENYSAGVVAGWGLDWETVHGWNEKLIYVTMSGCGHDGPWTDVISYAPTVHALCGLTALTNPAGRTDVGPGFSLNDHAAGFMAAFQVVAALEARHRTGQGQHVDLAQTELGTHLIGPAVLDWLANGHETLADGNADALATTVPHEVYATSDGFVAISVRDDADWAALVAATGIEGLAAAALGSVAGRRAERATIDRLLGDWARGQTAFETATVLQEAGVAAGPVQDARALTDDDPQLAARGFWHPIEHPTFGARLADHFPAFIDGERPNSNRLAPAYLGEHNFEIFGDLAAMSSEEIAVAMGEGLLA